MSTKWTSFDKPEQDQIPIQDILDSLSAEQKVGFLNAYTQGWADNYPKVKSLLRIRPTAIAKRLKTKLDEIQFVSRRYMRGEILITPAVIDPETGEETTPAIFNTPPDNSTELLNIVKVFFINEFTEEQVTAILTKMIKFSKTDGSGTWIYYKTEIVK